ncbi:MAG TPA: PIG-L family deacetylase [Anaerolineales bacterium]|nr:PIG-L family deacetylase [Anaerolineales bacterium]
MLSFSFPTDRPLKVLCLGAHSDDIEIGCGGTLLALAETYPNLQITWVVFTAQGARKQEALDSANDFLVKVTEKEIILESFRDGFLPYNGAEVKDFFERLKKQVSPDVIFTHYRHDLHQDHRQLCELAWNTWRNHLILEYEIPKYDGDLGVPNFFFPLRADVARQKTDLLLKHFGTQRSKDWFTDDTFLGLMRLRGMECKAKEKYAEAFYSRKMVVDLTS